MSKDRCVLLVFPHPKTIFGPAEERKRRINKRRHWQHRNNYTPLYPIYINKLSLGDTALTFMVKIIFQATARCVLKPVYGCEHVLHCRWNIWFSLAGPRPVTHSAGLMQSVYLIVTLTIHLWPTALQYPASQQAFLKAILHDLFCVPRGTVPTCHVVIVVEKIWLAVAGFDARDADLASPRLEHMIIVKQRYYKSNTTLFTVQNINCHSGAISN